MLSDIQPKTAMEIDCCKVYKRRIKQLLRQYTKAFFRAMGRAKDVSVLDNIGDFSTFGFRAARFAELEPNCNTELLLCDSVMLRLEKLLRFLNDELQFLNLSDKILTTVQQALSKQQKDMFLREQIRAIQHELGEDELSEADELEERIYDLERYIPSETSSIMLKSLSRLKRMSVMSPEYQVMKSHIEFLIDLPWAAPRKQTINPDKVRSVLDRDHFGMEKVKERIVEYMAVKSLEKSTVNTVICLYGPPGTGKTSIAKSIAEALNRKYIRVSLGGVHDEAEIRGHRKTYVGAMPGRILNSIKNCGSKIR